MAEDSKKSRRKYNVKDVELDKGVFCYFCGNPIEFKRDLAKVMIPYHPKSGKVRDVERTVHLKKCAQEIMDSVVHEEEKLTEYSEWYKCGEAYMKMMDIPTGQMSRYAVTRLQGLATGSFTTRGKNTKSIKQGFSYETLRMTILYVTPIVRRALSTMNFNSENHKTNYVMSIIQDKANFIDDRRRKQEVQKEEIQTIDKKLFDDIDADYNTTYVKKESKSRYQEIKDSLPKFDWEIEDERLDKEMEDLFGGDD